MKLISIFLLSAFMLNASVSEEEIYEIKAELEILKEELETTKILARQEKPSDFNPSFSVIGTLLASYIRENEHHHSPINNNHSHNHEYATGFFIRELEFSFSGDIDPFFSTQAILALEQDSSYKLHIHLEEAFIQLNKWPLETKIGLFKANIGRVNSIHLHDLNQTDYPLAIKSFLGSEGLSHQGISNKVSFDFNDKNILSIFLQGGIGKISPLQTKDAKKIPSMSVYAWWHNQLANDHFLDIGASSYLGRKDKSGSGLLQILAQDLHYTYTNDSIAKFILGTETFYAYAKNTSLSWGGFIWSQIALMSSAFLGFRYDIAPKKPFDKMSSAFSSYITYYTSEFFKFRFGYEHAMPKLDSIKGDDRLFLSMNFVLGAHPSEPYAVNR